MADGVLRDGEQDAGEQPEPSKAGHPRDVTQDFGLHGESHGEGGFIDVFGVAGTPVDAHQVPGVAFEEDFEVGGAGVAPGDGGEDAAFGREDGQASALFGEQGRGLLAGDVVGDELGFGRANT
ncbi:hypothetical protein KRM28CT15_60960 [Krasilnikovia sp. M28-CT-15]